MQASEQLASDPVLGKHSANGMLDQALRKLVQGHDWSCLLLTAIVARVREDHAIRPLLAGHFYFLRIDHNYMIPTINMRCVSRFVLATDYLGNLAGYAAEYLAFSVHQNPVFLGRGLVDVTGLKTDRIHLN